MDEFNAFLVEVALRKNQTKACKNCKSKHHKCTGTQPCAMCNAQGIECIFEIQKKRGPKQKKQRVLNVENNNETNQVINQIHSPTHIETQTQINKINQITLFNQNQTNQVNNQTLNQNQLSQLLQTHYNNNNNNNSPALYNNGCAPRMFI